MLPQIKTDSAEFLKFARVMLTHDEGLNPFAYDDKTFKRIKLANGANITIGIGRNLSSVGLRPDEIELCFKNDLANSIAGCLRIFGAVWFEGLDTARKLALVNMAFQMNAAHLLDFRNTMKHLRAKEWEEAYYNGKDSLWAKVQTPGRAERVLSIIKTGLWPY